MTPTSEELSELCREAVAGGSDLQFTIGRYMTIITGPGDLKLHVNNTDLLVEFCRAAGGHVKTNGIHSVLGGT